MDDREFYLSLVEVFTTALVPAAIAVTGWLLHSQIKMIEQRVQRQSAIRDRRVLLFSEMAPLLDDLLCFGTYAGHWRTISPPEALSAKRELDRVFFRNKFLWSDEFQNAYHAFVNNCFLVEQGSETTARSKANIERHRESWGEEWKCCWSDMFVEPATRTRRSELRKCFDDLHLAMKLDV